MTKSHPKKAGQPAGEQPERPPGNGSDDPGEPLVAEEEGVDSDEGGTIDLERELDDLRQKADEYYNRLLRSQAELQNVLKRHERDRLERAKYGAEALARDLLGVVDDLERAVEHAEEGDRTVVKGVELVLKGFLAVLERHGVEKIQALGTLFDPAEHEAVQTVETTERDPNTVIEEHRSGYRMHGRLLRPAMVAVAKVPNRDERGPNEEER